MDPVAQVFAQIGAATAHGEGMGQFFLQGRAQGLQEQQIGIQRDSLDLRSRMDLQDSLLKTFAHEQVVKKLDEQVGNEAALSALDRYVGTVITGKTADDPASWLGIRDILDTNPRLRFDPRFAEIMDDYKHAAKVQQATKQFAENLKVRREAIDSRGKGTFADIEKVTKVENWRAEADAMEEVDPTGAQRLRDQADDLEQIYTRPEPRPFAKDADMNRQRELTDAITDGEAAGQNMTREREELAARRRPTTEVPSENLVTGLPETRKITGRYIAPLDQQNRVISLRKNTDSLGIIEDLERNNATEFVGLKPMVENVIWNQILPQLGINKSNERQTMAKTDFVRFVQAGIRSLNQEARLSNQDATMLIEAFPNLDSMLSSPPQARAILKTLKRAVALGAVRDAKEAQRGVPPIAGKTLYLEDWFRTYEQGSLTLDEAKELARYYKSPRQPVR